MLKQLLFILFLVVFSNTLFSQKEIKLDTTQRLLFPKTFGEKKWKFFFDFDSRISQFNGQKIKINGVRIGATHRGVNRFGLGLYSLKEKIKVEGLKANKPDAIQPSEVYISFNFTTLFFEKVLYKTKRWEIALPTYYGLGSINPEYRNNLGNLKSLKKTSFNVLGLGVNTNFYIYPWLYPRIMFGYRFAFNADDKISNAFTKPFFAFGIGINPWGAFLHYKDWKKEKKEKPLTQ